MACHDPRRAWAFDQPPTKTVNRMAVATSWGRQPDDGRLIPDVSDRVCGCVVLCSVGLRDVSAAEFLDERGAVETEQLGGAVAVAAAARHRLGDQMLFDLVEQDW